LESRSKCLIFDLSKYGQYNVIYISYLYTGGNLVVVAPLRPKFFHPTSLIGPDFSPRVWKGGTEQAAEKRSDAVILSPFALIQSAAKNLALPLRVNYAKDRALSVFKAMRDSSFARLRTAAAPLEKLDA